MASQIANGAAPIIQVGASIPVVDGPAALGSVTVLQHRTAKAPGGGTHLFVEVRYRAAQSFAVRPEAWMAVPLTGEAGSPQPASIAPPLESRVLEAGQTATGWLEFALAVGAADVFLDYHDPDGSILFIVALS